MRSNKKLREKIKNLAGQKYKHEKMFYFPLNPKTILYLIKLFAYMRFFISFLFILKSLLIFSSFHFFFL